MQSIRSFSFHESRQHLDGWLDHLPHGENRCETKLSINSEGDKTTPRNVHKTTPKVLKENKSEVDNFNLKFIPAIVKEKTDNQHCLAGQEYKRSKLQFTPQACNVPQHQIQRASAIKLLKLELSSFSGDHLEWPEWFSLSLAMIDRATEDKIVKMNHLKTLVGGKAKAAIAGVGYSGQMYDWAWSTLERQFGRPQIIVMPK